VNIDFFILPQNSLDKKFIFLIVRMIRGIAAASHA